MRWGRRSWTAHRSARGGAWTAGRVDGWTSPTKECPCLQRGRGAAEDEPRPLQLGPHPHHLPRVVAGRLSVLVALLVLLVHNDEAEILDRREDRGAGPHCDPPLSAAQQPPGVGALAVGQSAVQYRHIVAEHASDPAHHLGSEPDLRHQHDRAPSRCHRALHSPEIDQGLAASGHPEQQRPTPRLQPFDAPEHVGLFGRELGGRRSTRLPLEGIPHPLGFDHPGQPRVGQRPDDRVAHPEGVLQMLDGDGAAQLLQGLIESALLDPPGEAGIPLHQGERLSRDFQATFNQCRGIGVDLRLLLG
jgi:hypothetical protein